MSKGPGRIERAIRSMLEDERHRHGRHGFSLRTAAVFQAAYGEGPWTTAQTVSALRALRRIIASEEGWTASFDKQCEQRNDRWQVVGRRRWFQWHPPKATPAKPKKVNEPIWAYIRGPKGSLTWRRATITSRGGADPHRVTVEYDGRKWQCDELRHGIHRKGFFRDVEDELSAPDFCHDSKRPEIEREHRDMRRQHAEMFGGGVSAEALAMLGLRHPYTRAEAERAFRAKSLKAHPDHGGDHDIMIALRQARDAALADADDDAPSAAPQPRSAPRREGAKPPATRA